MKTKIAFYCLLSLLLTVGCKQEKNFQNPSPTESTYVKSDMEEGSKRKARQAWIELIHQSSPEVYWKTVEANRAWERERSISAIQAPENDRLIGISQDSLLGYWEEKGSLNQAGSVVATTYDPGTDEIYLVSAGGSIFKSNYNGENWQVINQAYRFSGKLLDFIEVNGSKRLIGFPDGVPAWSDDYGQNWQRVENWMEYADGWGDIYQPVISEESEDIFTLAKPSYWSNLSLFHSSDGGINYREIKQMDSHDAGNYQLVSVCNSDDILLIDKVSEDKIDIYSFNKDSQEFVLQEFIDELGFGPDGRANMNCIQVNDSVRWMYFYDQNNDLYFSPDSGESWSYQSTLPERPWGVGIYVLPSDPSFLLMGAVECFKSDDNGKSWVKQNGWGEYYGNVSSKLHADMMFFREFHDPGQDTFIAISNHGGLSLSYDQCETTENIGLKGLNVSQYYSVHTDPLDPAYIYAGSQDQGFQRGYNNNNGAVNFTQTISGDYGHIVFSENGRKLWSVYPGGWVIYYDNPRQAYYPALSYTLESEDETVWIPPLAESALTGKNEVFMAGGNIDGGSGSYLIKLEVKNGQISDSQFDFDFLEASGGKVSAIHNPIADPNTLYVATTNGRFYYSYDYGLNWNASFINVAGSHYLYGSTIISSENNADIVYMGGSGYSTAPVLYSVNGGKSFVSLSYGLPATTVFDLALDKEEKYLFAATEAGPYVCILDQAKWYPMGASVVPNQTYWSVEYVPNENIVRFGTYGRGIWDFHIEDPTSSYVAKAEINWQLYPNPLASVLYIDLPPGKNLDRFEIINLQGKSVYMDAVLNQSMRIDLSVLNAGVYMACIYDRNGKIYCKKLIKE